MAAYICQCISGYLKLYITKCKSPLGRWVDGDTQVGDD